MEDEKLTRQYIQVEPEWEGPENARIVGYGVHVWALIGYLKVVNNEVRRVAQDYGLPEEAVRAAIAYYHRHRSAIDARLHANSAP